MRGCSAATARLIGVAVKAIAMPANSLSESLLVIVTPRGTHMSSDDSLPTAPQRIQLPSGVCDEEHSALDDLTPFARSKCPLLGVKRTLIGRRRKATALNHGGTVKR